MGDPSEPPPTEPLRTTVEGSPTTAEPGGAEHQEAATVRLGASPAPRLVAGRYEILGLLGEGGMGRVYRARDRELGELVALKVLQPRASDAAAAIELFRREARLARHVTHRNVVRIFDLGDDAGRKFITMELVDGESLATLLRRVGALPVARALELAIEVCAGVGAAHAAGIVHRDLKPANVLLARDGRVVLTDFGIATAPAEGRGGTLSEGLVVGTPDYMAPEQVEASSDIDARADVFAMGAMLYHVLAGRPPWSGASPVAIATARLYRAPEALSALRPDVSSELAAVVRRCLAVERAARFGSAAELARALEAVRRPGPTTATPVALPPAGASPLGPAPFGAPSAGVKTVAVLPFENQGAAEDAYVAEGFTDELADTLSVTPGLRVRASSVVRRIAARQADPREAGEALGVQVVVEGAVRRGPERTRIVVRLVGVADGYQLWARRFERPTAELLVASDEVARAIGEALTADVAAPARVVPSDAALVDRYLRARHEYRQRFSADAQAKAVEGFAELVGRMPDDPCVLAGYALSLVRFAWFAPGDPGRRARAREIAERAAALAPAHAEVRLALATVRLDSGAPAQGVAEARAALRANSCLAEAHELLGLVLGEAGRTDEAIAHLGLALDLDSASEGPMAWLARLHELLGDRQAASAWDARITSPDAQAIAALVRARSCVGRRDLEGARRLLATLTPAAGLPSFARGLATRQTTGALDEWSERLLAEMVAPASSPRRQALGHQLRAELASLDGGVEDVLGHVERAVDVGLFDVVWMDASPSLQQVREQQGPRFAALRAQVAELAAAVGRVYDEGREP